MDNFLLASYRSVTDDLLLLYDTYMIGKNTRQGLTSLSMYLDIVKFLIREEGEFIKLRFVAEIIQYSTNFLHIFSILTEL